MDPGMDPEDTEGFYSADDLNLLQLPLLVPPMAVQNFDELDMDSVMTNDKIFEDISNCNIQEVLVWDQWLNEEVQLLEAELTVPTDFSANFNFHPGSEPSPPSSQSSLESAVTQSSSEVSSLSPFSSGSHSFKTLEPAPLSNVETTITFATVDGPTAFPELWKALQNVENPCPGRNNPQQPLTENTSNQDNTQEQSIPESVNIAHDVENMEEGTPNSSNLADSFTFINGKFESSSSLSASQDSTPCCSKSLAVQTFKPLSCPNVEPITDEDDDSFSFFPELLKLLKETDTKSECSGGNQLENSNLQQPPPEDTAGTHDNQDKNKEQSIPGSLESANDVDKIKQKRKRQASSGSSSKEEKIPSGSSQDRKLRSSTRKKVPVRVEPSKSAAAPLAIEYNLECQQFNLNQEEILPQSTAGPLDQDQREIQLSIPSPPNFEMRYPLLDSMSSPGDPVSEDGGAYDSEQYFQNDVCTVPTVTNFGLSISWTLKEIFKNNKVPDLCMWIPQVDLPSIERSKIKHEACIPPGSKFSFTNCFHPKTPGERPEFTVVATPGTNYPMQFVPDASSPGQGPDFTVAKPIVLIPQNQIKQKKHKKKKCEKYYKCKFCEATFIVNAMRIRHEKIHDAEPGKESHYCPKCNIPYRHKNTMWIHLKRIHNIDHNEI